MAFALTSVYDPNPLMLGYSASFMRFTGILQEPRVFPDLIYNKNVEIMFMRGSSSKPGNRVFRSRGVFNDASYYDIEFESIVTPAQVNFLRSMFEVDNGALGAIPIVYSNGIAQYEVIFAANGLKVDNLPGNQRVFSRVTIKLHIVSTTSTGFGSIEID